MFGITQGKQAAEFWLNGERHSGSSATISGAMAINGYVQGVRSVNIYLNGMLANAMFLFKKSNGVEFSYTGDLSKFKQPLVLQLEIEK